MDYLYKINQVISKIESLGDVDEFKKILSVRDSASTSSELLMSVVYELLILVEKKPSIGREIRNDVLQLKDYCWSIGLQVKI